MKDNCSITNAKYDQNTVFFYAGEVLKDRISFTVKEIKLHLHQLQSFSYRNFHCYLKSSNQYRLYLR